MNLTTIFGDLYFAPLALVLGCEGILVAFLGLTARRQGWQRLEPVRTANGCVIVALGTVFGPPVPLFVAVVPLGLYAVLWLRRMVFIAAAR